MSIAKNYIYNVLLQITNILIPFITTPYISRVLDPKGLGIASFTGSIVQYFILVATLGTGLYGSRAIAYVRDNSEKLKKTFWNVLYVKLLTGFLAIIAYLFFVVSFTKEYKHVYFIQSLNLFAAIIDITYFFQGVEDFKKISTRSLAIRIASAVSIFLFIKKESDFVIYVLIATLGNLIGQLIMWLYVPKSYFNIERAKWNDILGHLIGSFKLFIPMVAIQIYIVLDKTMVGLLAGEEQVGYYDMAQRIVKMLLGLVTSIGPVMFARMSSLVARKEHDSVNSYTIMVFDFVTYLSLLIITILFTTMPYFVPVFFGSKFLAVKDLILIISPIILFISWSNLFGIQIMLPFKKENEFTLSIITGAVVNFTLNMLLIPKYAAKGASVSTVIAEFSVTLTQIIIIRRMIPLQQMLKKVPTHVVSSIGALLVTYVLGALINNIGNLEKTILNAAIVTVTYIFIEFILGSNVNKLVISKVAHSVFQRIFK